MGKLIVICEGGVSTAEYLAQNEVYADVLIFDSTKFKDYLLLLEPDDEVLLIIQGLTDFTMSEIEALMEDFETHKDRVKSMTVLSNIILEGYGGKYYYYIGDFFYGDVEEVENKKINTKAELDGEREGSNKGTARKNAVAWRYKVFNKSNKFTVYEKEEKLDSDRKESTDISRILTVDLFSKNTNGGNTL